MKTGSKTSIILFLFILSGFLSNGQSRDSGISFFEGRFKEAIIKAKEENKYIFLDAYASWCGPCKTMEKEVFRNPLVAEYFNNKFISIRIDMEKGEGPQNSPKC